MGTETYVEGFSMVIVFVVLGRRFLSNFLTIYLPTILLNIIGHTTVYFKAFFFEAIISVNLTVMLVLTTMFISVSNALPKTSYVKMVDIFLIASLVVPFVEVLLQTYIEYLRGKVEDNQTINHHGKQLDVEDGKVVGMSALGGGKAEELTPVETIQKEKEYPGLVNVDEKIQREALKSYYARNQEKINQGKLDRALYFAHVVNPGIVIGFYFIYSLVGYSNLG